MMSITCTGMSAKLIARKYDFNEYHLLKCSLVIIASSDGTVTNYD